MRVSKIVAGMMLALTVLGCKVAAPNATSENRYEKAEAIIAPWISDSAPGVAVAVSRDGEIVFSKGAGLASLEHAVSITPDSVFQVASISKQFTAFAIALQISEGKISLEDDIRQYLPDMPEMNGGYHY